MAALDIPELLLAVLGHLNQNSLAKCARVCRAWREPATELLWAQVQDLEQLVATSFSNNVLGCFKSPSWNRLLHMPYPELASLPNSPNDEGQPESARDTLAQAWCQFRSLNIDWMVETETFRMRTQRVTHIRLTQSSLCALLVIYILQETHPMVLQGIFPRLFALTIGNDHYAPLISQCVTRLPSLRHVTYEASSASLYSAHLSSWRIACQAALGLTSFSIQFTGDPDNKEYFGRFLEPHWVPPETLSLSLSRFPFVLTRPWKHIEIPGRLVGKYLFYALASIDTLETLTIHGSLKSSIGDVKYEGIPFKSLRELRLIDVSTTGGGYFPNMMLQSVQDLELRYLPEREKATGNTGPPTVDLGAIAQACPNVSSIRITVNGNAEGEQFVFNAELYVQENDNEPSVECPLVYLNIGCPPVYSAEAVSEFFSALFPNLRHVECPKSVNSVPCSRGDYFVWSQVVRTVQERDRDLDNLARALRARDLAEKHELVGRSFIVSSIDDSDEDYWAYSGSEDESYSSDED
ncbi:hypothetical protein FRC11_010167 [Ceratobasidium sp. 423]|nr:hypothetical protein FRC11_010167 [Ceratobasidium sp. 423]